MVTMTPARAGRSSTGRIVPLFRPLETNVTTLAKSYLFHDTVLANIQYGRPGASREEVEEAARAAAGAKLVTLGKRVHSEAQGCHLELGSMSMLLLSSKYFRGARRTTDEEVSARPRQPRSQPSAVNPFRRTGDR